MYPFKILYLHIVAFLLTFLTTVDSKDASKYGSENCKDWICVYKCCPEKQIIMRYDEKSFRCIQPRKKIIIAKMDYTKIETPKGPSRIKTKNQTCTPSKDSDCMALIDKSDIFLSNSTSVAANLCEFKILQDGSLESQDTNTCPTIQRNYYCVDFFLGENKTIKLSYLNLKVADTSEDEMKDNISAAGEYTYPSCWGMSISAFFILLILLVYGLLPKLQNIVGLVLMAYLLTFMVALVLRVVQIKASLGKEGCGTIGPPAYFFLLASFFWLNIMAFDIWWTIRGSRKCRPIHRQGEIVKFLWYTLYAWGTPLALTLGVVAVDQLNLYTDMLKPPFDGCYPERTSVYIYIGTPMGILTFVNLVLFLLTARELWLINQALTSPDSSNTKNNERFKLYIKLFLIMGVSWLLELVPLNIHFVLYIFVNLCNVLIGVILFIIFVCKKSIFIMLCNRFNAKSTYMDNLKSSQYSRSKTLSSSMNGKDTNKKHDTRKSEATVMENETMDSIYPEFEVMNYI